MQVPAARVLSVGIVLASLAARLEAGTCDEDLTCQFLDCRSPAFSVPIQVWGEIEPADAAQIPPERENSDWNEFTDAHDHTEPHWQALDVENGWIFAAINYGLQIWDARANPTSPVRVELLGRSAFPVWPTDPHHSDPVKDIDAPPGNDNIVAVALSGDAGLAVFNTTDKPNTVYRYADRNKDAQQVYAARIGSTDYSFTATRTSGLLAHNLTNAANRTTACAEQTPGQNICGVYTGRVGSRTSVSYVDGVGSSTGTSHWIAASSGGNAFGLEIWNVSNPGSPSLVFSALGTEFVHGVALWRRGTSNYYLGTRVLSGSATQARIYDLSCLGAGNCTGLGSPIWTANLPTGGSGLFVTDSSSGSRDFLYFGNVNRCSQGLQDEWLYDVSNPAAPRDVTPPPALVNGTQTGYWGWYYRRNPTGFNRVNPRMGKFYGQYFYRAAYSIFDIHRLTTAAPVAAFSYSPNTVYRGQPVSFTDLSSGAPTSWSWTFQSATPGSSTLENPTGVAFNSAGSRQVTLQVSNTSGSDTEVQNINVLDPAAQVGSVTVAPNPALVCQPVTFTAQGVTGLGPITHSWQVRDSQNQVVASGGNVNPFTWSTTAATDGTYAATVTVTNASGNDSATSPVLTLSPLPALAFTSPGNAPETLNGPPFGSGQVNFRIQSQGATEWRWSFGDQSTPTWTSDPVAGPQPSHTYSAEGTYTVSVEIRNCQQAAIASQQIQVSIPNTTPLVPQFNATGLFCSGGSCFADAGVPIAFNDGTTGGPDFWDYDWDGNGGFEDANHTSPVTSHTYASAGVFLPRLQVRRGAATTASFTHVLPLIVGGGAAPSVTVTGPTAGNVGDELTFGTTAANCVPYPTSWVWNVGENATVLGEATGTSITVVYPSVGDRTVQATAAGSGCDGTTDSTTVTIAPGASAIFLDGFDTGDLSAWGTVVP
ncbi:MAG TPA: PKD domain-containing protein [Thermoanaerobaculia bacterium]|nr:PKD domain-containing protein [Thermoanaerobaculia bacterium]